MDQAVLRRKKKALASLGAVAIGVATILTGVTAASALDFGNIDPSETGSITINKHEHQADAAPNGSPDGNSTPASPGVPGVEFTIYKINEIDLSVSGDWDKVANLQAAPDCTVDGYNTTEVEKVTTGADGKVSSGDLGLGAYLVCETDAPASVVDRAQPFIVTIPFPFQNGWLYDVQVYPKNGVGGITKEVVTPDDLGLGAVVDFPVTTDIPTIPASDHFSSYIVSDVLDERLSPVNVKSVSVDGTAVDTNFYDVNTVGTNGLDVVFTAQGLEWLKTQGGKKVVTIFGGTVAEVGDGEIANTATIYVNDPNKTEGTGITTPPVVTKWGNARILKTDSAATPTGLEGAEFEVYAGDPAYAPTVAECDASTATGNAITVGGKSTFTSNSTGAVVIDGLFVSDSNTGLQGFRCYILKETKAPNGFVTPTGGKEFTGLAVTVGETVTANWDATIKNTQQEVPELPLTGAAGQVLMIAGGFALLSVAVGLMMMRRRQNA